MRHGQRCEEWRRIDGNANGQTEIDENENGSNAGVSSRSNPQDETEAKGRVRGRAGACSEKQIAPVAH